MKPIHLSVGRFNIDIIVNIEKMPDTDEFLTTDLMEIMPGGAAVNYAVAITKLGHSSKLLAKVGKNTITQSLMESIAEMGVGLDYVEETNAPQSMALIFLRKNGKISMVRKLGASTLITQEDVKKYFGLFDTIHFASVPPNIVVRDPMARLISYDPGPFSKDVNEVDVDVLYLNEKESKAINLDKIRAKIIVIKMGEKGAKVITENQECYVEAYKVDNIVDTTGAGDVFDATFNYSLLEGLSIEEGLKLAVTASAIKIQRLGGISSPNLNEVHEALKIYEPKVKCI
ncbi:carbohydrate kinase family protein [Sulfurisphaera tokodaii]|uniref:Sugar kinase n=2 Tax=Sulfurisphaera tokodaii TaxID=111955 RepID=Q974T7_SULTO|nr:carbohydrate kinase family protein [Sulfurisphaera tokodaii]BAB65570.1 putative sugar kinase [Sulfurisphaera tokodaii str. 7]HII74727.1 carbohydrate kinase family protein [Sulfurisphaera tokodaii]